ncbi:hypothetical protein V9T40_007691 [Parthenolecanium corni]|uniref:Integrase catalytic domain-containing protein n=1 Tax=Parthenolecanium corni TaxID=536013 RepID=A0AAN9TJU8_9HEMI
MDIAAEQLKYSQQQATVYLEEKDYEALILRQYAADIQEDIDALEKYERKFGDKADEYHRLIVDAKNLKRMVEKGAAKLEILAQKKSNDEALAAKAAEATAAAEAARAAEASLAAIRVKQSEEEKKVAKSVKLPRIVLPIFDGETCDDYRGFIDAFNETLQADKNLSAIRKWLLLRAQLGGRALQIVQDLPMSSESYENALKMLHTAYGSTKKAVTRQYEKLQNLPRAEMETESLRSTNNRVEGILLTLKGLKSDIEHDFLRSVVLGKYPPELIDTLRVTEDTTLADFREKATQYIQNRAAIIPSTTTAARNASNGQGTNGGAKDGSKAKPRHSQNDLPPTGGGNRMPPPPQVTKNVKNSKPRRETVRLYKCLFCSGEHWSDACTVVTSLDERRAKTADRCQKCFKTPHPGAECESWKHCVHCKETTHNRALCPVKIGSEAKVLLAQKAQGESKPTKFITAMLPVGNTRETKSATTRAVLDTAGGLSLITQKLADQLQLTSDSNQHMRLKAANKAVFSSNSKQVKLLLHPRKGRPILVEACIVPSIVENVVSTDVAELKKQHPQHLNRPMPNEGNGEDVDLLLGYSDLVKIITLEKSVRINDNLQLMGTKFGWVPFGKLTDEADDDGSDEAPICLIKEVDPIKLMCDLETVGLADFLKTKNEEESVAIEKFYKTIEQINKTYQTGWPYKYDPPDLNNNFGLAFGRLVSLWKQLSTSPELLKAYDGIMREQVETDVAEIVNLRRTQKENKIHYLPHRGVIRIGKSTPVRIVFDASSRCGKGAKSLNDNILKGGNWVVELPGVLMRFRRYKTAITSDITRAFHQIMIRPEERDVARFLWVRDINKPPSAENLVVYRFKRMAFGIIASPFLLSTTIKHHLRTHPKEYTDIADIIESDLYADNLVVSIPNSTDSEQFYKGVKGCFADMGMNMTQWVTDDEFLRQKFEAKDCIEETKQSVLGLHWDTISRIMSVKKPNLEYQARSTKRAILKEMAKVYDPLGWMSPVTLSAKILLRKIWQGNYAWDATIQQNLIDEWLPIRSELQKVGDIELPRAYAETGIEDAENMELHAFCDASAEAYGVVVYLRIQKPNGVWTGIVASKTRLSPKTKISIPRLELLAAVIAAKYTSYVEHSLQIQNMKKFLWGDSKCVISWVSSKKILPAFVEKSVQTIKDVGFQSFSYVPTHQNPADVVSRGATVDTLSEQTWWNGPKWLADEKQWPSQSSICEKQTSELADEIIAELKEERKILLIQKAVELKNTVDPASDDGAPFDLKPSNFRSFGNLIRRTATCIKAAARFLRGRGTLSEHREVDFQLARRMWLRWDQQRIYKLTANKNSNVSYLRNLRVKEDEHRIIRCVTRIEWAKLPRDEVEPILLAKGTELTKLIILSTHTNVMHAGTAQTLAELRKEYWVPHGRREVYKVIKNFCFTCRRHDAQPFRTPELAPLPEFRISRTETPFTNVGVDAFGPYKIRVTLENETKIVKHWVLVFTCLVVRAVHLEVMRDMTAQEFLNSFRRFAGRRGVPQLIVSDNAPQFTVVEGIFQCMWRKFAHSEVTSKYYAEHNVQWRFIPAYAPWMGGAYERMIRMIKSAFEKVYGGRTLNQDTFEIAMVEVEAVVNSRPITYVDKEQQTEIISPNDFLCVRYPAFPIDFEKKHTAKELTDSWAAAEKLLDEFWRIWSEQYLRELKERRDRMTNKRSSNAEEPKPGEIVLMVDPDQKRSSWRTAVVERLLPGSDGKVRAVQIRASNRARMIRPVSKLASLKLIMDLPDQVPELTADNQGLVVDDTGGVIEDD